MIKTKLLTRQQIIEEWQKSDTWLDSYCCPYCRDILHLLKPEHKSYTCMNQECSLFKRIIIEQNDKDE